MNNKFRTLGLSFCLLASSAAMADDAVWGALLGGGAGAAIGGSVSGRNGAIVGGALGAAAGAVIATGNTHRQVEYVPAPVYHSRVVHYSARPVHYTQPVRVITPPTVYYVVSERGHRHGHYPRKDWHPKDNRWHGYR